MSTRKPRPTPAKAGVAKADVAMRPGNNGGQLQTGNPGNKGGGRPPDEFKALMRELASSPETVGNVRAILADITDKRFVKLFEKVADRGYGRVEQTKTVRHNGRVSVTFVRESKRGNGQ